MRPAVRQLLVRPLVACVALGALLAATSCIADPPDDEALGEQDAPAPTGPPSEAAASAGETGPIPIAVVVADLSMLSAQNLAPDLGDPVEVAQTTVDDINATGGVGGRHLTLTSQVIPGLDNFTPDGGRGACLRATQEDHAFAVVLTPAVTFDVARCVAVQNQTLTMTMASWDRGLYEEAQGRLFSGATNVSIGVERSYRAWPQMLVDAKAIQRGTKVGVVSIDIPEQRAGIEAMRPELARLGVDLVAETLLPCDMLSACSQQQAAVQKLRDAGAEVVFNITPTLLGVQVVQAAVDLDYHPRWTTIGQNVTDTVAQFYAPVKDAYDGALGVDQTYPEGSPEARACLEMLAARGGLRFERGSDREGFAAVICLEVRQLADAMRAVRGPITQGAVISAFESLGDVAMAEGPRGSFGPDKHDAGNHQFLSRYDASKGVFVDVPGTDVAVP